MCEPESDSIGGPRLPKVAGEVVAVGRVGVGEMGIVAVAAVGSRLCLD